MYYIAGILADSNMQLGLRIASLGAGDVLIYRFFDDKVEMAAEEERLTWKRKVPPNILWL